MELLKAIESRHSSRNFKGDQIKDTDLKTILGAGSAAPIGMKDYNSIHLTIVQNQRLLAKITQATAEAFANPVIKPFYGAPTVVIVSALPNSQAENIEYMNAGCIIQNMLLSATDLGISNVFLLGFIRAIEGNQEITRELKLPEGFKPVAAVALGYAQGAVPAPKDMKSIFAHTFIR